MSEDVHRQDTTAERGAWLDVTAACEFLGVADRTIYRRVGRGEIQRRYLPGGRSEFWIPGATRPDRSDDDGDSSDTPQDARDAMLAVLDRHGALMERMAELSRQQVTPLVQRIEELAAENGRLRAELEAERERRKVSDDTPDSRPWWRFW